jgi:hypothetical protein
LKTAIAFVLFVLASFQPALGQSGGHIGIFSDNPGFSECDLHEVVGVPNFAYVVHTNTYEASESQFKVQDNWGAFRAGEFYGGNLFLGSTESHSIYDGGWFVYVGCKPMPHLIVTLQIIPFLPTPSCLATLEVVPDPILPSGQIEVVDCESTVRFATGGTLYVNPDPFRWCRCPLIATEESTWSRVKALYR